MRDHTKSAILLITTLALACSSESRDADRPPANNGATGRDTTESRVADGPPADNDAAGEDTTVCGRAGSLAPTILAIAQEFDGQNIMYNSEPLSDCSGMFHRVLQSFDERCPGYDLPAAEEARDSRDIGRWYADNGGYTLVTDELDQAQLIQPGRVLFFGQSATVYTDLTLEEALTEIEHVGLVVAVDHDDAGELLGYQLFHGRSPGKPAAITNYHFRKPTRSSYRPFGNGNQQWIGVASLAHIGRSG